MNEYELIMLVILFFCFASFFVGFNLGIKIEEYRHKQEGS